MTDTSLRIIITGGAGGIAEAVLQQISDKHSGQVGLLDIDGDGLERVSAKYSNEQLSIVPLTVDLRDDQAVKDAMQSFAAKAGGIDILFANAGIMTGPEPFEVEDMAAISRSIDLNFKAVASSSQAAWSYLEKSKGQVIVNASGAGLNPLPSDVIYSASKAAAVMFARASALRVEETGIRFNVICPGVVDTPILNDKRTGKWRDEVHFFTKYFELIQPAEIADAVMRLISDSDSNGEVISIENRRKA